MADRTDSPDALPGGPSEAQWEATLAHRKTPKTIIAIAIVAGLVLILGCLLLLVVPILLPTLNKARLKARETMSATYLESITQGLAIYANKYDGWYPPDAEAWTGVLVDQGFVMQSMLVSPMSDGDEDEYIFLAAGRQRSGEAGRIILYEDPDHFEHGTHIAYDDMRVEWVTHDQFETLLAEQQTRDEGEQAGP